MGYGFYNKESSKDSMLRYADTVMLVLIKALGEPLKISKSNYVKGFSANLEFKYVNILSKGVDDKNITTGGIRTLNIEFSLDKKADFPDIVDGSLFECLVIDASSSTSIEKKLHLVSRPIVKAYLKDFLLEGINLKTSEYIAKLAELSDIQLYTLIVNLEINKLAGILGVQADKIRDNFKLVHTNFLKGSGYDCYSNMFQVGASYREAKGALEFIGADAFKKLQENPYLLLKAGIPFKKADKRAIISFKEDMWGKRRAGACFLAAIKHVEERGNIDAGSTSVLIDEVKSYGYLYMIGRSGKSKDHSYVEDIFEERKEKVNFEALKSEEGRNKVIRLLFEGARDLREGDNFVLKYENLPEERRKAEIDAFIKVSNKKYTYDNFDKYPELQEELMSFIISNKINKGETVVKLNKPGRVSLLGNFLMEYYILKTVIDLTLQHENEGRISVLKDSFEQFKNHNTVTLKEKQQEAIDTFIKEKITVLTGGPGTGKTFVVSIIVKVIKAAGYSFKLIAPTGKAAKRMTELSSEPAQTIHMLLGYKGGVTFDVDLLPSIDVIIVDEVSMVDPVLFGKLLSAIHPNSKLLLVGDPDQLPSIRAGNILLDVICTLDKRKEETGCNYVTKLVEIMRQKTKDGEEIPAIVDISKRLMTSSKEDEYSNFMRFIRERISSKGFNDSMLLIQKSTVSADLEKNDFLKIFNSLLTKGTLNLSEHFYLPPDFEKKYNEEFFKDFNKGTWGIITPYKDMSGGRVSTDLLNPISREVLNNNKFMELKNWADEMIKNNPKFRWRYNVNKMFAVGDKVLCTSNIYKPNIYESPARIKELGLIETLGFPVVNGDVGVIEEIYSSDPYTFGRRISPLMTELPEYYRTSLAMKIYSPFYKIKFEGKGTSTWFNSKDAEKLMLGYVFTVHKAQGSEYDNLMCILPDTKGFATPRMVYTALTRAKKKLILLTSERALESLGLSLHKDNRYTNISEILLCKKKEGESEDKYLNEEDCVELKKIAVNWLSIIRKTFSKYYPKAGNVFNFIMMIIQNRLGSIEEGKEIEETEEEMEDEDNE